MSSELWRQVADTVGRYRAEALRDLAEDLSSEDRDIEAVAALDAARALFDEEGDVAEAARCAQEAGLLLAHLDRTEEAVVRTTEALALFESQLLLEEGAECRAVLGRQLLAAGAAEQAASELGVAADALEEHDDTRAATTRLELSAVLLDLGRTEGAAEQLTRARVSLRRQAEVLDVAKVDVQLAEVARRRGKLDEALDRLGAAAAVFDACDAELATLLVDDRRFQVLLDAGRVAEAVEELESARQARRDEGVAVGVAWCDLHLSRAYEQLGRPDEAAAHRRRARAVFDAAGLDDVLRRPELTSSS